MTLRMSMFLIVLLAAACRKHGDGASGWTKFTETDTAVFRGQYPLVGDPSVIRDGSQLRMYYTGFDAYRHPQGPEICQATSTNGISWTNVPVPDSIQGRMLYTGSNSWSTAHETSFALRWNNQYYLYFIGYKDSGGGVFASGPVQIGLATATDGIHFTCLPDPVLSSSAAGADRDAISSPVVIPYHDSLLMIYSGFCYTACGPSVVSSLLAAMSVDGIHWIKRPDPVITGTNIPWASKGVAETDLVKGPDNDWYLFMTSVDAPQVIGVAKGDTPFGPWELNPSPIVLADKPFSVNGALAPSVLIENNRVRLWYHGFTSNAIQVGYAEASWPLKR